MSADNWSDDILDDQTIQRIATSDLYLSQTQIALRDGLAPEPTNAGLARQQRLAKMERELADIADFVADCDRYAVFMEHIENPCIHDAVPKLMGKHLEDLRRRALATGRQLRQDLATLRRQG